MPEVSDQECDKPSAFRHGAEIGSPSIDSLKQVWRIIGIWTGWELVLRRAGRQDGVPHAVNDFFVRGADRREHPSELRARAIAFATDEVIRAKPHTARHGNGLFAGKVVVAALDDSRLVIPLQDAGRAFEAGQGRI